MSRAYICDKCGLVLEEYKRTDIHPIWIYDPFLLSGDSQADNAEVHLCGKCYGKFKEEYLANLKETYGQG